MHAVDTPSQFTCYSVEKPNLLVLNFASGENLMECLSLLKWRRGLEMDLIQSVEWRRHLEENYPVYVSKWALLNLPRILFEDLPHSSTWLAVLS